MFIKVFDFISVMISIIGAGPAGSYLASLLARKEEVNLFEEHQNIGKPVQCTGITTSTLGEIFPLKKEFLVNKVDRAKIISPNGLSLYIDLGKDNLVIDRERFDSFLANKARDNGTNLFRGYRFLSCQFKERIKLLFDKGRKRETDILVGADGPLSAVAKHTGLFGRREFVTGLQARVNLDVDSGLVEFFLDKDYFGWVVPESDTLARVGVAAKRKSNLYLKRLLKTKKGKIKDYQAGVIPLYNPQIKTQKNDNIFLLGDAATQVKATTHGGIVQGLIAAEELSNSILDGRFDYEKRWRKRIGSDLWLGLIIRKIMDRFEGKDYDYLIKLFNQEKLKKILEEYDRDFPSKFLFKLILREPRLLGFSFRVF